MEDQSAVGMTEGVTESVEAPTNTTEVSPTSEQGEVKTEEAKSENYVSRAEYNKRAEAERKLRREHQQLKQQWDQAQEAIWLNNWLRQDPKRAKGLEDWIRQQNNPQPQTPQVDPFNEFDPVAAEQFRAVQELKAWREEMMRKVEQWEAEVAESQKQQVLQSQMEIDREYDERLKKEGYVNKDGQPTSKESAKLVSFLDKAILGFLAETAKNPEQPTKQEFDYAYKEAMAAVGVAQRQGLKKTITPHVPVTGSRSGMPATPRVSGNRDSRINNIMKAIGA